MATIFRNRITSSPNTSTVLPLVSTDTSSSPKRSRAERRNSTGTYGMERRAERRNSTGAYSPRSASPVSCSDRSSNDMYTPTAKPARRQSMSGGWSPSSPSSASYGDLSPLKRQRNSSPGMEMSFASLAMAVMTLATLLFLGSKLRDHSLMDRLESAESMRDALLANQEKLLLDLEQVKREPHGNSELVKQVKTFRKEAIEKEKALAEERRARIEQQEKASASSKMYSEYVEKRDAELAQLHQDIARASKAVAEQTFGPGPHYVEFEVKIWEDHKPYKHYFTVETAPLEDMPTSVNTFLQQVKLGLWDGTSFYLNARHIIMSRPVSGNGQISKRAAFEESGFGNVMFSEYSDKFPHDKYTLGFAGSPPGPGFYINKTDNHKNHGPESGNMEPAFAKIVAGLDTIEKISAIKALDPEKPTRIQPVDIAHVKILPTLADAHSNKVSAGATN